MPVTSHNDLTAVQTLNHPTLNLLHYRKPLIRVWDLMKTAKAFTSRQKSNKLRPRDFV